MTTDEFRLRSSGVVVGWRSLCAIISTILFCSVWSATKLANIEHALERLAGVPEQIDAVGARQDAAELQIVRLTMAIDGGWAAWP